MTSESRSTARQLGFFYLVCLAVAGLLALGEFQGPRNAGPWLESLELGTGGYIDRLKFGGPVVVTLFILIEWIVLKIQRRTSSYDWKDSAASFCVYIFNGLLGPLTLLWQFGILKVAESWSFLQLDDGLIPFLATFVLAEGAYYWYHRLSHEIPLLWAVHHIHHSAQTLNLSIAFRLHILGRIVSPLAYVPMVLAGFKPEYLLAALALSLVYQFFIHTEAIRKLGFVEHSGLNTPSLHRVHHGSNEWCIDKNYAGVLIFWDRAFGTFQREIGPIRYGVTTGHYGYSPVKLLVGPLRQWWRGDFARERDHVKKELPDGAGDSRP
ncbi:MAG: sterol desaturase family protein [Acidobacteriota bacterium]|nr:sterol desaturase family protein [Acidobacteriota bacterium]